MVFPLSHGDETPPLSDDFVISPRNGSIIHTFGSSSPCKAVVKVELLKNGITVDVYFNGAFWGKVIDGAAYEWHCPEGWLPGWQTVLFILLDHGEFVSDATAAYLIDVNASFEATSLEGVGRLGIVLPISGLTYEYVSRSPLGSKMDILIRYSHSNEAVLDPCLDTKGELACLVRSGFCLRALLLT